MALTQCPDCEKKVSDKAAVCPHCGCEINSLKKCGECGALLKPEDTFCPECGYSGNVSDEVPAVQSGVQNELNKPFVIIAVIAALLAAILAAVLIISEMSNGGVTQTAEMTAAPEKDTYTVSMQVDCKRNLLIRYDVDVVVDGTTLETLAHGAHGEYTLQLEEGTYKIVFCKNGESSVRGETTLKVSENMNVSYQVQCHMDYVEISRD